jgi:membrane associated rhomboid family serine protease
MSDFHFTRSSNFPPVVKNLIIINALVFFAQAMLDSQIQLTSKLALWPVKFDEFHPYQIATNMFAHGSLGHLFFNMLALWLFGKDLENIWGHKRFLFFYLSCGVGAAALHMGIQYFRFDQVVQETEAALTRGDNETAMRIVRQIGPALGASGAIMGVMAAFAYLFPNTAMVIPPVPVPVKAKWLILFLAAGDLFSGIANTGKDNIGHFAHLGGALTGIIIVLIWNKTNRRTLY